MWANLDVSQTQAKAKTNCTIFAFGPWGLGASNKVFEVPLFEINFGANKSKYVTLEGAPISFSMRLNHTPKCPTRCMWYISLNFQPLNIDGFSSIVELSHAWRKNNEMGYFDMQCLFTSISHTRFWFTHLIGT